MPEDKGGDIRIQEAKAVTDVKEHRGYKILEREWAKVKEEAFGQLCDEKLDKDTVALAQLIYNRITKWMKLADSIIEKGNQALEEAKQPKLEERNIKKNIPFVGRRY